MNRETLMHRLKAKLYKLRENQRVENSKMLPSSSGSLHSWPNGSVSGRSNLEVGSKSSGSYFEFCFCFTFSKTMNFIYNVFLNFQKGITNILNIVYSSSVLLKKFIRFFHGRRLSNICMQEFAVLGRNVYVLVNGTKDYYLILKFVQMMIV